MAKRDRKIGRNIGCARPVDCSGHGKGSPPCPDMLGNDLRAQQPQGFRSRARRIGNHHDLVRHSLPGRQLQGQTALHLLTRQQQILFGRQPECDCGRIEVQPRLGLVLRNKASLLIGQQTGLQK